MKKSIKKIGVIGAGTMGSGIAAQAANAGIEVVLLDKFEGFAEKQIKRMQTAKPTDAFNAGFMIPENAKNITPGTVDDNLGELADCDLVIESILAPHPIRQQLYKDMGKIVRPDTIFSSNTSTMQTDYMIEGQSDDFKKRFLNTHFFNPVRFMHLLEVISGEHTDPDILPVIAEFGDKVMGKKVVHCKDARGFIANRIGVYFMERAKTEALKQGKKIEDVDALMGKAFGFPHLGVFKLADEVGLDVIHHVRDDLNENLAEGDEFLDIFTGNDELVKMMDNGFFGNRKVESKGGYFVKTKDENGKIVKKSMDLFTGEHRDFEPSQFFKFEKQIKKIGGLQKFLDSDHEGAKFSWPVIRDVMLYVLNHSEEFAYDLQSTDDAMRAGFNWELGPFELMDKFGVEWFANKLESENITVPPLLEKARSEGFYRVENQQLQVMDYEGDYTDIKREEGMVNLEDIKRKSKPLVTHHSASLWDIGNGVTCLEFHSQQNSIDPSILHVMNKSIKFMNDNSDDYKALVIYNDGERFSLGANLGLLQAFMGASDSIYSKLTGTAGYIEKGMKGFMHEMIYQGQAVYTALNQAPFPVISAPKGTPKNFAFGGGMEVLLSSDAVQAGPEQIMGLPEAGLGVLPGWAGSTRYLQRAFEKASGVMDAVGRTAMALGNPMASMSTSSQDGKKKLWLRKNDGITMNPDRVLADAKAKALDMVDGYKPEPLPTFRLPGITGKGAIRMDIDRMYKQGADPRKGGVNHVDVQTLDRIADVLTGGERLELEDVDRHAVNHQEHLKDLIGKKEKGCLNVNETIEFNYPRMMQLERDNINIAFNDKVNTWPRINNMLKTGRPLREDQLDPQPVANDLRDAMDNTKLERRDIEGAPLTGHEAETLKAMADMTDEFYKQNAQRGKLNMALQATHTIPAAMKVFRMF